MLTAIERVACEVRRPVDLSRTTVRVSVRLRDTNGIGRANVLMAFVRNSEDVAEVERLGSCVEA